MRLLGFPPCNRLQRLAKRCKQRNKVTRILSVCLGYDVASVANIYEVAKRAGVSTATVSRVLSQPAVVSPAYHVPSL